MSKPLEIGSEKHPFFPSGEGAGTGWCLEPARVAWIIRAFNLPVWLVVDNRSGGGQPGSFTQGPSGNFARQSSELSFHQLAAVRGHHHRCNGASRHSRFFIGNVIRSDGNPTSLMACALWSRTIR